MVATEKTPASPCGFQPLAARTRTQRRNPPGTRNPTVHAAAASVVAAVAWAACAWAANAPETIKWRTGSPLDERLATPLEGGAQWSGRELRDALRSLSRQEAVRVPIVLDRRVDPGQKLEHKLDENLPLADALEKFAAKLNLGVGRVGPVLYVGPRSTTQRLWTVAEIRREDSKKLPATLRRKLDRPLPTQWDDFAQPRNLLEELAAEGALQLVGLDQIPHDLWAGVSLPPMALADRFSLILAAYDLTFEVDAANAATPILKFVPMPPMPTLTRGYPLGDRGETVVDRMKAAAPTAHVELQGTRIVISGRAEDHQRALAELRGKKAQSKSAPAVALDRLRSSINAQNQPVGKLLEAYAEQLKLELQFDTAGIAAKGRSLKTLVSVQLDKAPVKDVLTAITKPAGLTFEIRGKALWIGVP